MEVLERLDGYVDGTLDAATRAQVEAHVQACDTCARFGGRYGAVVTALRQRLGAPQPVPGDVAARLRQRLGIG